MWFFGIAFLTLFWQCAKPVPKFTPLVLIQSLPQNGNTTQIVSFEAIVANSVEAAGDLFYRWDWDGDQIWDTKYTTSGKVQHRYYAPGEYRIQLQILTLGGEEFQFDTTFTIVRGYSRPKPEFRISPDSGNFRCTFRFDCQGTKDDEDSLNTLLFRWDVENDGTWESNFSNNRSFDYRFAKPGKYPILLEVKDPSGLSASRIKELIVNTTDTLLRPDFLWESEHYRVADTFRFDARRSAYSGEDQRSLTYQWLFPYALDYTPASREQEISFVFVNAGYQKVTLRVVDQYGLTNTISKEVLVSAGNDPPKALIRVANPYGNVGYPMYFDSWLSTDDLLSPSQILAQWDFDGDGIWDTPMSTQKEYNYQYSQPGVYWVKLRIEDDGGNLAEASQRVIISPWSNKTGYFRDGRDGQLYGTVQIGDQTWMAENLKFFIPWKDRKGTMSPLVFFRENSKYTEDYGIYYNLGTSIQNKLDAIQYEICPSGWHIPTKEDWEILIRKTGADQAGAALAFGGSTDFNGILGGYLDWIVSNGDTIYTFKETYKQGWFMSATEHPGESRADAYIIKIVRDSAAIWTGYESVHYFMPVRCIKY